MNSYRSTALLLATTLLAAPALATEASKSLAERRMEVIKGTAEGKKILDLGATKPTEKAASAPSTPPASTAAPVPTASAAGPQKKSALFSNLPPPSGKPLNAARRTEGPGVGIAIPSAAPASQATPSK